MKTPADRPSLTLLSEGETAVPAVATAPEAEIKASSDRLVDLYWQQLVQLRVHCDYMRLQQARLRKWVRTIAVIRAGASVGALGGWAVVQSYPAVWSSIIVLAQIADAMQGAIPFNRHYQGANALVITLDALFITALGEWEDIHAGRLDQGKLAKARLRLMQQIHEAQTKQFPDGLQTRSDLMKLAEASATAYMQPIIEAGTA